MHNMKILGLVGLVGSFGIATLVGCGGDSAPAPTLVLSNDNAQNVASQALVGGATATNFSIPGFGLDGSGFAVKSLRATVARIPRGPIAAAQTTPCAGGGTQTVDGDITAGTAGGTESITFANCIQDAGSTDSINGSAKISISGSATSATFSVTLNLTIKTGDTTVTESGSLSSSLSATGSTLSAKQISVAVSSPTVNTKITLSNLEIQETFGDNPTVSQSYDVDDSQLGGRFSVDTDTPLTTTAGSQHPSSGQITVTGAKDSKLVITVLGDETSTPAAGQGQVKLELSGNGANATIYMSWQQVDDTAGDSTTL